MIGVFWKKKKGRKLIFYLHACKLQKLDDKNICLQLCHGTCQSEGLFNLNQVVFTWFIYSRLFEICSFLL